MTWCRASVSLCGLRLWVRGKPAMAHGIVMATNHVSYLDIPVLGSLFHGTFVAKSDVARWPLFGFLAKLQRTVFIRRDPGFALEGVQVLKERLSRGERLILFPEGTSSNGLGVLPFKSSMFAAVHSKDMTIDPLVQPVSIAYARYADGGPLNDGLQDAYAWHGDMTLFDHLMGVFGHSGAMIEVTFHPAVRAAVFPDRKALAKHCQEVISSGVREAHCRRVFDEKKARPTDLGQFANWDTIFLP